ncbi:MAG TPA: hypothetical protein VN408_29455, partial [Actinoplanes sp.]|nr:hypothetical protein [Actinoplanes sp.]
MPIKVTLDTRTEPGEPRRAPRWTVPALLVTALALGLAIGMLGGPGTGTSPEPVTSDAVDAQTPMDLHDDEDHGGHGVGQLPVSDVATGRGGTRTGPTGLPAGFPNTQAGAAAAATVYLVALTSTGVYE